MANERKTIKDLSDVDLKDLVDSLVPEYQGKVQDIQRGGRSIVIPSSMPIPELFRFLIYTWLLDRHDKGELVKALDIVQIQMWSGSVGFKLHADEELVKDMVRAGFVFDAQLGAFHRSIPMTKEHPLPDREWVDSDIPNAIKWFNAVVKKNQADLKEMDRLTNGSFSKLFKDSSPAQVRHFVKQRQSFGHGESGFTIIVQVNKLSGYDYMDEAKVQKVVDELNASLHNGSEKTTVNDAWWQEFMRRVDDAIQEEGPKRDAVIEWVAELVAKLPKE